MLEKPIDIHSMEFKDTSKVRTSKEPLNTVHRLLYFDNDGNEFANLIFKGWQAAQKNVLNPDRMEVGKLIEVAHYSEVNPMWLFIRVYSDYIEKQAQAEEDPERLSKYHQELYDLSRIQKFFKESLQGHFDECKASALLDELLPSSHDKVDQD